jgi:trans-4-hydroxy-L-proline dehydratase
MPMTRRVQRLRQESLDAVPSLSAERAQLMTACYRSTERSTHSAPMRRALSFEYLMEHRSICILPGELIVGEKGPAPKAAPTYPELCCHSLEDLDILDRREKIPFKVSSDVRQIYAEEIIPYWQGSSMRERILQEMRPEWIAAYEAGIYTEFMEQRAPGIPCWTTRSTAGACSISSLRSKLTWTGWTTWMTPAPMRKPKS